MMFSPHSLLGSLLALALCLCSGMLLTRIRIRNISLGMAWILFAGILLGHFGLGMEAAVAHFVKSLGLILFVCAIGLQVGPGFGQAFRNGGLRLNALALAVVAMGVGVVYVVHWLSGEELGVLSGLYAGAVTNTPALGAAQQGFEECHAEGAAMLASAYACAYPLGTLGVLLGCVVLSRKGCSSPRPVADRAAASQGDYHPHLLPLFLSMAVGLLLGSVPIPLPGLPSPLRLGLAGGPLVAALAMGRLTPRYRHPSPGTTHALLAVRDLGVSLFLACVGLEAGHGFVDTLLDGGYRWVLYGLAITLTPLLTVSLVARHLLHLDTPSLLGLLAGSHTSPTALAYANSLPSAQSSCTAYAAVYPLTMLLRILTAQMLVLL